MTPLIALRKTILIALLAHSLTPARPQAPLREFFNGAAFRTAYSADLSYEEKVAGLSLLWSQAKAWFVYFDRLGINWDQTYLDYLPKVKNTTSTAEYYKVLMLFYAQLKDGHTNVYPPVALRKDFYSRPPLYAALVEGRVVITEVYNDTLAKDGFVPGLEILQIDGQPVTEYAEKNIAPYQSSSTPQDLAVRTYSYSLFTGAADRPITLSCRDSKGHSWTKTISRSAYTSNRHTPTLGFSVVGNNIGLLAVNNFEDNTILKQLDSLFPRIQQTSALIIDIRHNGGGSSSYGDELFARLTDKPFRAFNGKTRKNAAGRQDWDVTISTPQEPSKKFNYPRPVALLIGPRTFSAAEDFALIFDYMQRGPIVGSATGGSTGQPFFFDLPGGGSARVCTRVCTYPDGREFVGSGIAPTISVEPTIRDIRAGIDAALQKAMKALSH